MQDPRRCPKCGEPNKMGLASCAFCGIVFARFVKRQKQPPKLNRPPIKSWLEMRELKQLGRFFHHAGQRLKSGQSLSEALQALSAGDTKPARVAARILPEIDQGSGLIPSLYAARPKWPSFVWAHLEAGEASGQLPGMMLDLAEELERRRQWVLSQLFNLRTLYLIVVLGVAAFSLSVLGAVGGLSEETLGTDSATVLQAIITSGGRRFIVWLAFFGFCAWLFVRFQLAWKHTMTLRYPIMEAIRLKLPLTSHILRKEELASYLRLLALCLKSGLTIHKSLQLAQSDIGFPMWRQAFDKVLPRIDAGSELSTALGGVPGIDQDLIQTIRTGEVTGGLSEMLEKSAQDLKERAQQLRATLQVVFTVLAFGIAITLTIIVLIKGFMAPFALYERAF